MTSTEKPALVSICGSAQASEWPLPIRSACINQVKGLEKLESNVATFEAIGGPLWLV